MSKLVLHKYHIANGHTAKFFDNKEDAVKEIVKIIRAQVNVIMKANKKPQYVHRALSQEDIKRCENIRALLKASKYQDALDSYNYYFAEPALELRHYVAGGMFPLLKTCCVFAS